MTFVAISFGLPILVLILFKVTTFLAVMTFGRKSLLWLYLVVWIVVLRFESVNNLLQELLIGPQPDDYQLYELMLLLSWNQLKMMSACLDLVDTNAKSEGGDVLEVYAFTFYLPNLVCGPIFLFERYTRMMETRNELVKKDFRKRYYTFGLSLMRVAFWYLFMEFALHYFYVSSLQTNIQVSYFSKQGSFNIMFVI